MVAVMADLLLSEGPPAAGPMPWRRTPAGCAKLARAWSGTGQAVISSPREQSSERTAIRGLLRSGTKADPTARDDDQRRSEALGCKLCTTSSALVLTAELSAELRYFDNGGREDCQGLSPAAAACSRR